MNVINFSGGRSSGFMLKHLLDNNLLDNNLLDDSVILFCNTGKELENTLQFVKDVEDNWNVPIHWLEYNGYKKYKKVNFETASRNSEPFDMLIKDKKAIPDRIMRFCTQELKVNTVKRFLKDEYNLDYDKTLNYLGIRYDEPKRWLKIIKERCNVKMPLVHMRIRNEDVLDFWDNQNFDLTIHTLYGNCDLCFLKSEKKKVKIIREKPELLDWWIEKELEVSLIRKKKVHFNKDYTYTDLFLRSIEKSYDMNELNDISIDCFCGD